MASIWKRGSGYEVRIRRKGYKTVARHFRTRAEAEKYELVLESEMSRAVYVDGNEAERTTLRGAPTKMGHQEACRARQIV